MHQLGWILTLVWVALLFAGWIAFIMLTIYNAFKGNLKQRRDTQADVLIKAGAECWGLSNGARPPEPR